MTSRMTTSVRYATGATHFGQRDGANGTQTLVVHSTKRKVGSARSPAQTKSNFARISAVAYRPLRNASEQTDSLIGGQLPTI